LLNDVDHGAGCSGLTHWLRGQLLDRLGDLFMINPLLAGFATRQPRIEAAIPHEHSTGTLRYVKWRPLLAVAVAALTRLGLETGRNPREVGRS